jgi:hypothetical protein
MDTVEDHDCCVPGQDMEARTGGRSARYCPTCQAGGEVLADGRLSRLLK